MTSIKLNGFLFAIKKYQQPSTVARPQCLRHRRQWGDRQGQCLALAYPRGPEMVQAQYPGQAGDHGPQDLGLHRQAAA